MNLIRTSAALLLALAVCWTAAAAGEDAELVAARANFDTTKEEARSDLLAAFDKLDKAIDTAKKLVEADRGAMLGDVRAARKRFDEAGEMTPILAMQPSYVKYVTAVRKALRPADAAFSKAIRTLPTGADRRRELSDELVKLTDTVNALDSLKEGKFWKGFRSDYKQTPRFEPTPFSCRKFRKVQDGGGTAEFALKVEKRQGSRIIVEVSQNGGAFVAEAAGTFDGVNLSIEMTKMRRGDPRHFVYRGQVVGGLGLLELRGIKADGKPTVGQILLELAD